MFNLPKVERAQFYLEAAFKSSQAAARGKTIRNKNKRERKKKTETYKISVFSKSLKKPLLRIKAMFPNLAQLDIFYKELFETTIDKEKFGKAMASLSWVIEKISKLEREYVKKILAEEHITPIDKYKKDFFGRAASVTKKIGKHLLFLDKVRKRLRTFPSIKTKMPTLCICGLPNVGKSTLLSKLTTAKPKIEPYAFTTKTLMLGYLNNLQIIDAPGTFKELLQKMNWIEKQSYLAIKYLSNILIYVFDISETCGFVIEDQLILFRNLKKKFPRKKIIIYFSKNDMIPKEKLNEFVKKHDFSNAFFDVNDMKKYMVKLLE